MGGLGFGSDSPAPRRFHPRLIEVSSALWQPGPASDEPEEAEMERRKVIIVAGGAVAVLAMAGGAAVASGAFDDDSPEERRAEAAFTEAHAGDVAIARAEAEAAALRERPGSVVESNLEDEGDGLAWEVAVTDGSTLWEIQIDAWTAEVLGVETEGHDEGADDD
jgi:uncharacterized membrane protein YkoI